MDRGCECGRKSGNKGMGVSEEGMGEGGSEML